MQDWNLVLREVAVPSEFPRRTRDLDLARMKGNEFMYVMLVYSVPLARILANLASGSARQGSRLVNNSQELAELWSLYTYVANLYHLPDEDFRRFDPKMLEGLRKNIYQRWVEVFLVSQCPYNVHVALSHLDKVREVGDFALIGAWRFEHFFGEWVGKTLPGTPSTGKQQLQKLLLSTMLQQQHVCETKLTLRCTYRPGAKHRDNLVYASDGEFYELLAPIPDGYMGRKFRTTRYHPPWAPPCVDYDLAFVRYVVGQVEESVKVPSIVTKAVLVEDVIIRISRNILLQSH
ncbi:unnamed protein product [Sphagnum tenellum]